MPTITEIKDPLLKHCRKHDIHCSCPNCKKFNVTCLPCEQTCESSVKGYIEGWFTNKHRKLKCFK